MNRFDPNSKMAKNAVAALEREAGRVTDGASFEAVLRFEGMMMRGLALGALLVGVADGADPTALRPAPSRLCARAVVASPRGGAHSGAAVAPAGQRALARAPVEPSAAKGRGRHFPRALTIGACCPCAPCRFSAIVSQPAI